MLSDRMDFAAMAKLLPNGFHDANVEEFTQNISAFRLTFVLDLWIGTMDQPSSLRERYRRGRLEFERVKYFAKTAPYDHSDESMSLLNWDLEEDAELRNRNTECKATMFFELNTGHCQFEIACDAVFFQWIEEHETNRNPEVNRDTQEF